MHEGLLKPQDKKQEKRPQANLSKENEEVIVVVKQTAVDLTHRHFCSNNALIKDFIKVKDGENVYMENNSNERVLDKGKIIQ